MDADGPNGSTGTGGVNGSNGDSSVLGDMNGDCVGSDETSRLAQTAIIKQVKDQHTSCSIILPSIKDTDRKMAATGRLGLCEQDVNDD